MVPRAFDRSKLPKPASPFRRALRLSARLIGRLLLSCCCIAIALTAPARAEDPPRRVGSLNYLSGEVTYALRGEAGEPGVSDALAWSEADFNQPVCQDMSLKTGAMARARVRIGPDAIQMSGDTWLNMLNLSDQLIEASVRYGRVHLELRKLDGGETVELEMPRGSLWLLEAGAYDIDTGSGAEDQPTRIVVFEGKARFIGGQADVPIAAGEEVQLTGSYPAVVTTERSAAGASPTAPIAIPAPATTTAAPGAAVGAPAGTPAGLASVALQPQEAAPEGGPALVPAAPAPLAAASEPSPSPAPVSMSADGGSGSAAPGSASTSADAGHAPADDFLLWVEKSDDQPQSPPQSARYVSPQTTGYDALDRYGRWDTLADSEPVWFPTSVPDDWAPYRFGHWDSIPPWGWTWIDDQPWGFAPFHYGRWVNVDGHWGWVPGAVVPHPVYAPALVAFIDAPGDSGGAADGGPDVGWFPLGPDDDYAPWYQAGPDYVESVNAPVGWRFRELRAHGHDEHAREAWGGRYSNRRFASVVSRQAFASSARVDRALMRVPADRLEHAAVMRGAPRMAQAALRSAAASREFHGEIHGEPRGAMPLGEAAGGFHGRPSATNPAFQRQAGSRGVNIERAGGRSIPAAAGQPGRGGERPGREFGRSQVGYRPAQAARAGSQQFGRSAVGRNPAEGYRGNPQQFGRPQVSQSFRGARQFSRPQVSQGFRGAQQVGRPQVSQSFRGAQQFGRPQTFRAPAAAYRGGAMVSRGVPQVAARPAAVHLSGGAGGGGRHK